MSNKSIEDIDKNFIVPTPTNGDACYLDIKNEPFEVSGLAWFSKEKEYLRIPLELYSKFNEGIQGLAEFTAGAVLRFKSDSPSISIKVELINGDDLSHMPRTGMSGFDFYIGTGKSKKFIKTAMPGSGETKFEILVVEGLESDIENCNEFTVNFPLYNGVKSVQIGLTPNSRLEKPTPYLIQKPIIFYGSSITQGGCASRPGNAYTHILSRWLDANFLNFGFSGSAKGEPEMAKMLASLEMSAFVMDYDHNAPDAEHLKRTHENFFKIIRKAQPKTPVIFVTKTDYDINPKLNEIRKQIVYSTYRNAVMSGDKYVLFVDGQTLFGVNDRDACTVDGVHPNDLGFMRMAENIYPTLREALS